MTKQILQNRWFIWALVAITITGFSVWGFLEYSNIKMNDESAENLTVSKQTQKSAETNTANWQTYRNEKYGFELKYPVSVYTQSYSSFANGIKSIPAKTTDGLIDFLDKKTDSLILEIWAIPFEENENEEIMGDIRLKNSSGWEEWSDQSFDYLQITRNRVRYVISYEHPWWRTDENGEEYRNLNRLLVDTFKFTK